MKGAFKPYEGAEKYIFVSYSHKDCERVLATLEELNKEGFRIWYDEGIEWGTEWPESIANHLDGCTVFMAFLSKTSIASRNCRQEVNYALKRGKEILSVYLEEVELSKGMDMQLTSYHSTFPYQYADQREFYSRLSETQLIQCCRNAGNWTSNKKMADSEPPREKEETIPREIEEEEVDMPDPAADQGNLGRELDASCVPEFSFPCEEPLKQQEEIGPQDLSEATEELDLFCDAQQRDTEEKVKLGDKYYNAGKFDEALKWYKIAAKQCGFDTPPILEGFYFNGMEALVRDYSKAISWYRKATKQNGSDDLIGQAEAQMKLGDCYFYDYTGGIQTDYFKAREWYEAALESYKKIADRIGQAKAQLKIGHCYYMRGYGREAVSSYEKVVEQGVPYEDDYILSDAQERLGDCYYEGYGVQMDRAKTIIWYRKAAELGNPRAQRKLGDCYYYGSGVPQDYNEAARWYLKVAEGKSWVVRHDLWIQVKLADCYFWGDHGIRDLAEAEKWYQKAAESGDADFKEKLANHRKENERRARIKNFANFIRKLTPGGRKEQ